MRFWFATAVVLFTCACVSAQTPAEGQSKPAATFDSARAFEHLKRIVEIGPRPAGSGAIETARDYIKNEMKALGLAVSEQGFEASTPAGPLRMVNLRVTVPGASNTGRLIIAGHYDTKRFDDITFVGANDAGSSTAFLIELARVLKDRKNPLTIELLFLDGEEAIGEWATGNTYGSRHYVFEASQHAASLRQIKAMILVDMIADKEPTFKRDENSTPWLTDVIWSAARKLNRTEFSSETTFVEDDHLPFLRAGIPAVDIIDLEYPDVSNRYWHTAEDTLDKVSPHGLQVVGDVLLEALPAIELRVR